MISLRFSLTASVCLRSEIQIGGTAGAAIIGDLGSDNTLSVFASADGASGPIVSINKAALLSALTINTQQSQLGSVKNFKTEVQDRYDLLQRLI